MTTRVGAKESVGGGATARPPLLLAALWSDSRSLFLNVTAVGSASGVDTQQDRSSADEAAPLVSCSHGA